MRSYGITRISAWKIGITNVAYEVHRKKDYAPLNANSITHLFLPTRMSASLPNTEVLCPISRKSLKWSIGQVFMSDSEHQNSRSTPHFSSSQYDPEAELIKYFVRIHDSMISTILGETAFRGKKTGHGVFHPTLLSFIFHPWRTGSPDSVQLSDTTDGNVLLRPQVSSRMVMVCI